VQVVGLKVAISSISLGTHRSVDDVQLSLPRFFCSVDGMIVVGTQRPSSVPFSLQQLGKRTMGLVGPGSHERLHEPVLLPSIGLKQGTHFSKPAHADGAGGLACPANWGMATFRQRPSAPSSDAHVGGMKLPPDSMKESGTQKPPLHVASCAWRDDGTSAD